MSGDDPTIGTPNIPPELFAVFSEEAEEKALDISRFVANWKDSPDDVATLVAIQMRFAEYVSIARTLGLSISAIAAADVVSEITHVIAGERSQEDSLEAMFEEALHSFDAAIEWLHGEDVPREEVFSSDDQIPSTFVLPDLQLSAKNRNDHSAANTAAAEKQPDALTPSQLSVRQELPNSDPSILALFLEEWEELLSSADDAWESWSGNRKSSGGLPELKRHLHTIKGGARMVGLSVLGDVVHDLETTVSGPNNEDIELIARVRRELDQLHNAHEKLSHGKPANFGTDLAPLVATDAALTQVDVVVAQADTQSSEKRQREVIRVPASTLDAMRRHSSTIGSYRARMEQLIGRMRLEEENFSNLFSRLQRDSSDLEFLIEQLFRSGDENSPSKSLSDDDMDRIARFQLKLGDVRGGIYQLGRVHEQNGSMLSDAAGNLSRQSRAGFDLSESLLATRLVPVSDYSARLKRIVRQACEASTSTSNGQVTARLEIQGERLELDRALIERILGPLEHLLRNAVAHGIENVAERRESNKPEIGNISLSFEKASAQLKVRLEDDGRGLDRVRIRSIAETKGLITPSLALTLGQVDRLIFLPGFSSSEDLSQLSGRGVGMDVVETEVRKLGGKVEVSSVLGEGALFSLDLPLGLSTVQGISVSVGNERYAVPFAGLAGVLRLDDEAMRAGYDGKPIVFQERSYSMVTLAELIGLEGGGLPGPGRNFPALLAQSGDTRVAVVVEQTYETGDYAVQTLPPLLAKVAGLSGAVMQGDGSILPILDLISLYRDGSCKKRAALREEAPDVKDPEKFVWLVDSDSDTRRAARRICERLGYGVVELEDGDIVIEHLDQAIRAKGTAHEKQTPLPDLILTELTLPRVGGLELLKRLSRDPRYRGFTVAVLAGENKASPSSRSQAKRAGVVGFVDKRVMKTKLAKMLTDILDPERQEQHDA
jgi:chemosensory pili system protein ChpA (sensor histidine kinase/response regulator)